RSSDLVRVYDEAGIGNIFFVVPAFNITESRQMVALGIDSYNRFPFIHFRLYIFGLSLGYTGSALPGGFFHQLADFLRVRNVLRTSYRYSDVHGTKKLWLYQTTANIA